MDDDVILLIDESYDRAKVDHVSGVPMVHEVSSD